MKGYFILIHLSEAKAILPKVLIVCIGRLFDDKFDDILICIGRLFLNDPIQKN